MKQKNFFGLLCSILLSFVVLVIFSFPLFAQFNLNKLKEAIKKPETSTDCRMKSSLEGKISTLKHYLDNYNANYNQSIESDLKWAKEYLETVKKECPTVITTGYDKDISDIEQRYSAVSSNQKSRDEAIQYIVNASNEVRDIIPVTMEFRGDYKFDGIGEKLLERSKKVDYNGKRAKIIELMNKYDALLREGYYGASEYHYFFDFPKLIETNFNEYYKKEINLAIEKVYQQKSEGRLSEALSSAESVQKFCESLLEFAPSFQELASLKKDADNAVSKLGSAQTSLFTSDFHKQNSGKILFSKSPIEIKKENPSQHATEFAAGDLIYGMIYLKDSFKNITNSNSSDVKQFVNVDGKQVAGYGFKLPQDQLEQTYLYTEIVVPPDKAQTGGVKDYVKGLSVISPRNHKVEVVVQVNYNTIAKGEFNLDCSNGTEPIEKISKDFETIAFKSVVMPKPAKKDAKLEGEMMKALSDWPETPLKAVITDDDWSINRNVFGVIEFRSISAAVAVKKPDGKCRLFWLSFKQDYNGKSYGKTQQYGVGDSYEIPCENVK